MTGPARTGVRRRKDGELVVQDEDLGILGQRRAAEQHQPAEEAVSRPVRRWSVLVRDTGTSTTNRATASDQNVQ
jgi:hypothetical protein